MGTLQLHPEYVKVYLQLAIEFDLPVRMDIIETASYFDGTRPAEQTALSADARRAWAETVAVSGGMALVSDDLSLLAGEARDLLDEVIGIGRIADDAARRGEPARCADLMDHPVPRQLEAGGYRLTVDPDAILRRLEQIVAAEGVEAEEGALRLIATRAAGSMRDSQSLLEQLLGCAEDGIRVEATVAAGRVVHGTQEGGA